MQWVLSIIDRIRPDDPPEPERVRAQHPSQRRKPLPKAPPLDAEGLRSEVEEHIAHTQMSVTWRSRGYELLIPGHLPIRFSQAKIPVRASGTPPSVYEETTTLVLNYVLSRFRPAVLFDVGAGLGHFSRVAASHASYPAKAYAFEIRPDRMDRLKAYVEKDPFGAHVAPLPIGLTNAHKGQRDIWYASSVLFEEKPNAADLRERWRWLKFNLRNGLHHDFATARVQMTSLDHFVEMRRKRPDIIKIDVDGYEGRVLQGGIRTLSRYHPFVLLEIHKDKKLRFGMRRRDVTALLFNLGYQALFLTDHQRRANCDVVAVEPGHPLIERQETDLILFFHPDFQHSSQDDDA